MGEKQKRFTRTGNAACSIWRERDININCRFLVTFQRVLTISKMQMHSEIRINYIQNDCAEEGSGNLCDDRDEDCD